MKFINANKSRYILLSSLILLGFIFFAAGLNLFIFLFRRSATGNSELSQNSIARFINFINADSLILIITFVISGIIMIVFGFAHIRPVAWSSVLERKIFLIFVLSCSFPWLLGLSGWKDEMNTENRMLAPFPVLNLTSSNLLEFPQKFESFLNDHLPLRNLINQSQRSFLFTSMGISPVSSVIAGKQGWLFYTDSRPYDEFVGIPKTNDPTPTDVANFYYQESLWLAERNIQFYLIIVPDKETVYPEFLPASLQPNLVGETSLDLLINSFRSKENFKMINLRSTMEKVKEISQVYYKTDTHWNDLGAYFAYREIMNEICADMTCPPPRDLSDYDIADKQVEGLDLARFLGVPHLSEIDPILTPKFSPVANIDTSDDKSTKPIISTIDKSTYPSAIIFRDSFFIKLVPDVSEHFRKAIFLSEPYNRAIIDQENPDIVVVELVERKLVEPGYVLAPGK